MRPTAPDHDARVDAWMRVCVQKLDPAQKVDAFEEAFGAVWRRASRTLGHLTLGAILERVLYDVVEANPSSPAPSVGPSGLSCDGLRASADDLPPEQLEAVIRGTVTGFLTVLGRLTAEILSPALHAELSALAEGAPRHYGDEPTRDPHLEPDDGAGS